MTVAPTPAPPVVASSGRACAVCATVRPDVTDVEVEDVCAAAAGEPTLPLCADCAPLVAKTMEPAPPKAAAPVDAMARCPFCEREVVATTGRVLLGHPIDEARPRDGCPGVGATVAPHRMA